MIRAGNAGGPTCRSFSKANAACVVGGCTNVQPQLTGTADHLCQTVRTQTGMLTTIASHARVMAVRVRYNRRQGHRFRVVEIRCPLCSKKLYRPGPPCQQPTFTCERGPSPPYRLARVPLPLGRRQPGEVVLLIWVAEARVPDREACACGELASSSANWGGGGRSSSCLMICVYRKA